MRTKLMFLSLVVVAGALVGSSIAVGAKPSGTTYKLKASLNIGQEKPIPKGTKLGASGRFTAKESRHLGRGSSNLWRQLVFARRSLDTSS